MSVWALLMAAGSGERMGLGRNKVLADLCGKPVLLRSAEAFETAVDGMVVVVQPRDEAEARALLPAARFAHGSATRQQSVLAGLRALPEDADVVLVHDAARPLVSREVIRRCIAAVRAHGSGVASVPVKDTIKRCAPDGTVLETPPRAALRAAQTPQAFHPAQLRRAIEALEAQGVQATDDAAAMEAAGHPVFLVEGDPRNLKLTTPEDMTMAAALADGPFDALVPVPLHPKRLRERGFNQARALCDAVGRLRSLPVVEALWRERYTRTQTRLNADKRISNVRGAFVCRMDVRGMRLVLVDDVRTTGATARNCAETLLRAGAESVTLLTATIARPGQDAAAG